MGKEQTRKFDKFFEKYRLCKYVIDCVEELPPERQEWKVFCDKVEAAVNYLPQKERDLIQSRFMVDDYVLDCHVYKKMMITCPTYNKIRNKALDRISGYFEAIGEAI